MDVTCPGNKRVTRQSLTFSFGLQRKNLNQQVLKVLYGWVGRWEGIHKVSFNFIHFSNMLTRKLCLKNISSNLDNNFFMGFKILCEVGGGDTQFSKSRYIYTIWLRVTRWLLGVFITWIPSFLNWIIFSLSAPFPYALPSGAIKRIAPGAWSAIACLACVL